MLDYHNVFCAADEKETGRRVEVWAREDIARCNVCGVLFCTTYEAHSDCSNCGVVCDDCSWAAPDHQHNWCSRCGEQADSYLPDEITRDYESAPLDHPMHPDNQGKAGFYMARKRAR